jgi:predicted DNA-binding transcriptional regulator AlpA
MMPEFLTPAELSAIVRKTGMTLRRWRLAGTGPRFVRLESGHVLYPLSEVQSWLKARATRSASAQMTSPSAAQGASSPTPSA